MKKGQLQLEFQVAYSGSPHVVEYLLTLGATLHDVTYQGETIAHLAANGGNLPMLEFLAQIGINLDVPVGDKGPTPLHCAVKGRKIDAVAFLIKHQASPNHVNRWYAEYPCTPLTQAIWNENSKNIVQLLEQHGAKTIEELER